MKGSLVSKKTITELSGARVLITGASKGIGAAMAHAFASAGANVALAARSHDILYGMAERLGGSAHEIDLADGAQLDGFIARVEAEVGPIDVLVNNAGAETSSLIDRATEADISAVIALNLVAPERLIRQVLPGMLAREKGHIVSVSSLAGVLAVPGTSVYSSTKAGLSHFMAIVERDLKATPIGTTLVEPGPVSTEMWDRFIEDPTVAAAVRRGQRLQLFPSTTPETIAHATVDAVAKGKAHVRFPKRLMVQFLLENAPRRLGDLALLGLRPQR